MWMSGNRGLTNLVSVSVSSLEDEVGTESEEEYRIDTSLCFIRLSCLYFYGIYTLEKFPHLSHPHLVEGAASLPVRDCH